MYIWISVDERINNDYNKYNYIQWIQFNEFKNIEYLAKGGFGEVHKATWINYNGDGNEKDVVLKRIYNSSDKILDILKKVKKFLILIKSFVNLKY